MVGKGVVDALMATLAAVQGEGAPALPVQEAACRTLWNLADAADNRVRWCDWSRLGFQGGYVERFFFQRLTCFRVEWRGVASSSRTCGPIPTPASAAEE